MSESLKLEDIEPSLIYSENRSSFMRRNEGKPEIRGYRALHHI
jgi:hypothetical protein